ncbi:shikimate kinase [Clostridium sp. BJN0001]|uniref:shikimate kinase n=1 Tax=Clostridium sp. BJN0001 TaxID=2930219 RepID=UPI001FD2CB07|nr:shikimate kinase [Clostridium sp. BJN0001]
MKKSNVLLIGMPGCGKSTVGKIVAKYLNMDFIDMDDYIEKESGTSIPKLFEKGEEYFRDLESSACKKLSLSKNTIISTGGGAIKRKSNIDVFRENSIVIFIDRPLDILINDVDIDKRPLLKEGREKIVNLYKERYNLYVNYSDVIVKNDGTINKIISKLKKAIVKVKEA